MFSIRTVIGTLLPVFVVLILPVLARASAEKDFKKLVKAAEHGDTAGQLILARLYDPETAVSERSRKLKHPKGGGGETLDVSSIRVEKSYPQAAKWYRMAAEQGDLSAQIWLGVLFYYGAKEIPQDFSQAAKWFQLAVAKSDPYSMAMMATLYGEGRGVVKDFNKAVDFVSRSARANNKVGQWCFAQALEKGLWGIPVNLPQAARLYKLASEQGYTDATKDLAAIKAKMNTTQLQALAAFEKESEAQIAQDRLNLATRIQKEAREAEESLEAKRQSSEERQERIAGILDTVNGSLAQIQQQRQQQRVAMDNARAEAQRRRDEVQAAADRQRRAEEAQLAGYRAEAQRLEAAALAQRARDQRVQDQQLEQQQLLLVQQQQAQIDASAAELLRLQQAEQQSSARQPQQRQASSTSPSQRRPAQPTRSAQIQVQPSSPTNPPGQAQPRAQPTLRDVSISDIQLHDPNQIDGDVCFVSYTLFNRFDRTVTITTEVKVSSRGLASTARYADDLGPNMGFSYTHSENIRCRPDSAEGFSGGDGAIVAVK